MMVTFYVVSEYSDSQPLDGSSLKIAGGPLYDLARIQQLVVRHGAIRFWTRKSEFDASELNLDVEDIAQWLQELKQQDFRNSEWCTDGSRAWAACDAYVLRRSEWIAAARKNMPVDYFLKFALAKTGALVLMVSCHTSS
jgi:hypothetical protein